jgi:acetyl-CoA carboxylase biotin carboxyl carrier protein
MNFEEIQELIKLVKKSELTDFKLRDKDFKIRIRTKNYQEASGQSSVVSVPQVQVTSAPSSPTPAQVIETAPTPVASTPIAATPSSDAPKGKNTIEVKSPIVGTFYRSPGPDKPPFVKVGDTIKEGDVVCIIEAMKLFNEIESDATGTIVKVCVEDAAPVEYDQVLFLLEV